MPVGDYFRKIFGGPFRKETDMGDGSHADRVIAVPPADMVVDGRLLVDAEMTFPPAMVVGDRLKVNLDEPIDVILPVAMVVANRLQVDATPPAALINANRLKVEVDDPIDVNLPNVLITGGGVAGISPRIRVDPGQTGFFAGRMFRSFFSGIIPVAGPSVQFRFTAPINFILWVQNLELTQGALQLEVYTGATPSGTWVQVPIIGLNRMSEVPLPTYASQITIETSVGGTGNFTGGTRVDLMQIRTSSANNSANNVGGEFSERGLPAAVFYGRLSTLAGGLTVNDAAQYIYRLQWEERP